MDRVRHLIRNEERVITHLHAVHGTRSVGVVVAVVVVVVVVVKH